MRKLFAIAAVVVALVAPAIADDSPSVLAFRWATFQAYVLSCGPLPSQQRAAWERVGTTVKAFTPFPGASYKNGLDVALSEQEQYGITAWCNLVRPEVMAVQ
jgi:hypothetical protein